MKRAVAVFTVAAIGGLCLWYFTRDSSATSINYRFVTVEQGDVEAVVSSTGTLEAVTTVEVGTQVSGIISNIFVDFNDQVEKGQVIARLDTTLLESAVRDAEATQEKSLAQLRQAEREYARIEGLFEKQIISESEYNTAQFDLDIARASARSAEVALERARQNLAYATIYAPISGTVVERNVDVGQTVAASFTAPQLFLIADDLSRMQILAAVDESDIGNIEEGQAVRFTVQAYPDDTFTGTVRQVRLQSTVEENVVNYTVVVDVDNKDGRLLPGMTATVDFIIRKAAGVLKVANSALRFRPSEEMVAEFRARRRQREAGGSTAAPPGSGKRPGWSGGGSDDGGGVAGRRLPEDRVMLWYLDEEGRPAAVPVRTGISDGQFTEISGEHIEAGMPVIAGIAQGSKKRAVNPFQSQDRGGRPGPPPPGF